MPDRVLSSTGMLSSNGHFKAFAGPATYAAAAALCEEDGLVLAEVRDTAESDLLSTLLALHHANNPSVARGYFLGGSDAADEGVWRWRSGHVFWVRPPGYEIVGASPTMCDATCQAAGIAATDAYGSDGFGNWADTEPNSGDWENCVLAGVTTGGRWLDFPCDVAAAYVCMLPPPPPPPSTPPPPPAPALLASSGGSVSERRSRA